VSSKTESGTSVETIEIPDSLPYPEIADFDKVPSLKDKFCYVIKDYPHIGMGLVVVRKMGQVRIRMSDFSGKEISPDKLGVYSQQIEEVMSNYSGRVLSAMRFIRIPQAMFYFAFADEPRLVDVRLSLNKFCGPGWISDFLGKQEIALQEQVGSPLILNEDGLKKIQDGDYGDGNLIFKPSAFKSMVRGEEIVPLYGRMRR
jgi:hypothetical protein